MGFLNDLTSGIASTIDDWVTDPIRDTLRGATTEPTSPVEDGLDQGANQVYDISQDGFQAVEGFLRWVAGFGETVRGLGEWLQANGRLIPLAGDGVELVGAFFAGIGDVTAGFFHGVAGAVTFIEAFFAMVQTLNGYEGAGFLLGAFLVAVSLYLMVSSVTSLQFLIVPSFVEDVTDAFLGAWLGATLIIWATANFLGSLVIAGTGVILVFTAINSERGALSVFGFPATILGFGLFFAAWTFHPVVVLGLTVASTYGVVSATEYLEHDVAPSVSSDERLVGGGNAD